MFFLVYEDFNDHLAKAAVPTSFSYNPGTKSRRSIVVSIRKGEKLYRHISFQMFSLVFSKIPNGFLLVFLNSAAACGRYDLSNSKPWAQEPLPRLVGGLTMTVETPFCRRMEAAFCAWVSE